MSISDLLPSPSIPFIIANIFGQVLLVAIGITVLLACLYSSIWFVKKIIAMLLNGTHPYSR